MNKPTDLESGYYTKTAKDGLSNSGIAKARLLPAKSILVTCIGATIGKTGIIRTAGASNQQINAIVPYEVVVPEYLYFACISPVFQKQIFENASATTLPILNKSKFKELLVPLAPISEQRRIVAKIETLFTRLEAGVAALKRAQAELKRYKAAVLKAACEGRLVPQDPSDEPAESSVNRILVNKAKNIHVPNVSELPVLPVGWTWTGFELLAANEPYALKAGPFGSSLKKEMYASLGYKIYGQEQVIRGDAFYGDYYIDGNKYSELKSCAVKTGDILISLVGTIGKVLILPHNAEAGIINPRLVKLTLDKTVVEPKYIKSYLESVNVRGFWSLSSHGETMDVLNLKTIKALPIPLPPLAEQRRIMAEVERRLSVVAEMETTVAHNLARAERLRQAILKRAFAGKLVAQDPSDEPAERLLERLREERKVKLPNTNHRLSLAK